MLKHYISRDFASCQINYNRLVFPRQQLIKNFRFNNAFNQEVAGNMMPLLKYKDKIFKIPPFIILATHQEMR